MALIRATPLKMVPRGVSDAVDGTNSFPGAMTRLSNLIPSSHTRGVFVPRPASIQLASLSSLIPTPGVVTDQMVVGNILYGMCPAGSGAYAGHDVPFVLNLATGALTAVTIPGGVNSLPISPAATGAWVPPTMAIIGGRVVITHPGYSGANKLGWIDVSNFADASHTGNTHSSTLIDGLSANVLQAGWQVGYSISGAGIPANTTIAAIAANGLSLTLSQAATATATGVALTVAGGSPANPLYGSGNTNGQALIAVPVAVFNFNGRAYYAVPGGGMPFSDSANPLQITNATQVLNPFNGLDVTAFGGLPFTQSQGGILQALIAFQDDSAMQQITGDPATNNLALNEIGNGVGCIAPNSIIQTPLGLAFMATDGLRYIDLLGRISEPIGADGQGVQQPFINAAVPSRIAAAYNSGVIRISVQNAAAPGEPTQEYWYDINLKSWTGPHTFPAALIDAWQNTFVMAPTGVAGLLFRSDVETYLTSSYLENGSPMYWAYESALLPDNAQMSENAMVETAFACEIPPQQQLAIQASDERGVGLNVQTLLAPLAPPTIWGGFIWGFAPWGSAEAGFYQRPVNWSQPLVFKQIKFLVTGVSAPGFALGNLYLKYQPLGYLLQVPPP